MAKVKPTDKDNMATSELKPENQVQLIREFIGGNSCISNIVPHPDSATAWIHCFGSKDILLVDNTGEIINKVTTQNNIHQITWSPNNELLITCPDLKLVQRFTVSLQDSAGNEVSYFTSIQDGEPRGITVNRGVEVVVGIKTHEDESFELQCYDTEGSLTETVPFDAGSPERLTSNPITSDIAVIGAKEMGRSSVVVFTFDMFEKFQYSGKNNGFSPEDIAFDVWNHLVICDVHNFSIILLNEKGILEREIFRFTAATPSAIGCFPYQAAWIGGTDGYIKVIRYMGISQQSKYRYCHVKYFSAFEQKAQTHFCCLLSVLQSRLSICQQFSFSTSSETLDGFS